MTTTEIKKELYKQKPTTELLYIRKGVAYYDTTLRVPQDNESFIVHKTIFFEIPIIDMGETDFLPNMDAKLLIRWMCDFEQLQK